ncbi:MAG: ABC transporter substrate-binding protein, partial [Nitrospinae bacterium]|nr:ABC transporter substrate-binding protein [Nitrospinota bacterium]
MGYKRAAIAALIAGVVIAGGGCVRTRVADPDRLTVALEAAPRRFDPRLAGDAAAAKIGDLLFNGLVRRADDMTIVPDLAVSWESPEPTRHVFHLREGVTFHDGRPFTAADVKATFDFILDAKNVSPYKGAFSVVAAVEAPDPRTVVFTLTEPSAPFLGNMTRGIVPAGMTPDQVDARPVGTGPFAFVAYEREQALTLTRFDRYWEGAAKVAGVTVKFVADETVRVLELEAGGVDLVMNPITPDLLPRLRRNPDLVVMEAPGTNYSYLGFNLRDRFTGDHAVREAIACALDRESIIRYLLKGLAVPADGPLSAANPFHAVGLPVYPFDPAKAKRLLDEAGYKDPDGDGPAVRFTLSYATSQNEQRRRIAEVFQNQLATVGVGMKIESYEWGTFFERIKSGNFQLFSLTWVGMVDPDIFYNIFHSAS